MKNLIKVKNNWILKTLIEHSVSLFFGLVLVFAAIFIPFEISISMVIILIYLLWAIISVRYFYNDEETEFNFLISFIAFLIILDLAWNYFDYKPANDVIKEYKNLEYVWSSDEQGISYQFYNPETKEIIFTQYANNPNFIKKKSYTVKRVEYNYRWSQITNTKYIIEGAE